MVVLGGSPEQRGLAAAAAATPLSREGPSRKVCAAARESVAGRQAGRGRRAAGWNREVEPGVPGSSSSLAKLPPAAGEGRCLPGAPTEVPECRLQPPPDRTAAGAPSLPLPPREGASQLGPTGTSERQDAAAGGSLLVQRARNLRAARGSRGRPQPGPSGRGTPRDPFFEPASGALAAETIPAAPGAQARSASGLDSERRDLSVSPLPWDRAQGSSDGLGGWSPLFHPSFAHRRVCECVQALPLLLNRTVCKSKEVE